MENIKKDEEKRVSLINNNKEKSRTRRSRS